jgi:serine/threonine-protein kinase RsbW
VPHAFHLQVRVEEPAVFAALDRCEAEVSGWGVGASQLGLLRLALEELLLNVCHHSGVGPEATMDVDLGLDAMALRLQVADPGPSFDPFAREAPDTGKPPEEREIGGLGIHFVQQTSSRCNWRRAADRNVVTVEWDLQG